MDSQLRVTMVMLVLVLVLVLVTAVVGPGIIVVIVIVITMACRVHAAIDLSGVLTLHHRALHRRGPPVEVGALSNPLRRQQEGLHTQTREQDVRQPTHGAARLDCPKWRGHSTVRSTYMVARR